MRRYTAALVALLVVSGCSSSEPSATAEEGVYVVDVPAGTAESGGDVSSLLAHIPQERYDGGVRLLVNVGDTLKVINRDSEEHTIGLVVVRPGETLSYTFSVEGDFVGICTLLAGEELTVRVT